MNGIPEATPIRLMEEERAELLSLARSTKTEYRMRGRLCPLKDFVNESRRAVPSWLTALSPTDFQPGADAENQINKKAAVRSISTSLACGGL